MYPQNEWTFGRMFGQLINDVTGMVSASKARMAASQANYAAERRAARELRRAEREARQQRREWYDLVERQKTRGDAGDATPKQAREALRGRGGRSNPLDQRKFR